MIASSTVIDGNFIEMLEGPLREGDLVVTDQISAAPKSSGNTSPFASGPRMR